MGRHETLLVLTDEIGSSSRDRHAIAGAVAQHFQEVVHALLFSRAGANKEAFVIKNIGDSLMIRCPMAALGWDLLSNLHKVVVKYRSTMPLRILLFSMDKDRVESG